ncbi:M23 family metallopeptidase [Paenibacillus harenae]|uniref:M23 family metallopeptidase n=1 Tax=Paenibacillus harenae TaxID=306543 RepID=UPI0004037AF5|nr:M23 family metallopeptidase [Paenibacillus harenae]
MPAKDKLDPHRQDELDPEDVWKANPNPWRSWDGTTDLLNKRSYVKGPAGASDKDPNDNRRKHSFRKEVIWKLVIASLLFAGIWGMFEYETEWTVQGRAFVKQALTDEIDFGAAAAWYKETFAGAPSFIPIFQEEQEPAVGADGTVKLPVTAPLQEGVLIRTFAELLDGIELAGGSEAEVMAVETGRVLLLSEQGVDGSTIVIQHANGRVSIYGKLGQSEVKANDWVEAGDRIGYLQTAEGSEPSLLYFAVKENDRYIDPVDVIPLD